MQGQTIQRTVTIGVNGATKRFEKGDPVKGESADTLARLRRAGAFGDDAEALGESEGETVANTGTLPQDEPDFDGMTVAELRDYAGTNSIDLDGATKKADVLAKVKAARDPLKSNGDAPAAQSQAEADAARGANVPEGTDTAEVHERPTEPEEAGSSGEADTSGDASQTGGDAGGSAD